jgi:hypothetical protein
MKSSQDGEGSQDGYPTTGKKKKGGRKLPPLVEGQ